MYECDASGAYYTMSCQKVKRGARKVKKLRPAPDNYLTMSQTEVLELGRQALMVGLQISLPVLLTALVVGLLVSVFQAVTQIQEMSLQFVPKILAVSLVAVLTGGWMLTQIVEFTVRVFSNLPPK